MRPRSITMVLAIALTSCDPAGPDPNVPARLSRLTDDHQFAEIGQPLPLSVRAIDALGWPVAGATVLWQVTAGGGTVEPTSVRSESGVASAALLAARGENRVVARVQDTNLLTGFIAHGCSACGQWSGLAPLTEPRAWASAAVAEGRIWVIGGDGQLTGMDAIDVFEPATLEWRRAASLPRKLIASFAAAVQDRIYVIGDTSIRSRQGGRVELLTSSPSITRPGNGPTRVRCRTVVSLQPAPYSAAGSTSRAAMRTASSWSGVPSNHWPAWRSTTP